MDTVHALAVDKRPVGTAFVDENEASVRLFDLRVEAGDL